MCVYNCELSWKIQFPPSASPCLVGERKRAKQACLSVLSCLQWATLRSSAFLLHLCYKLAQLPIWFYQPIIYRYCMRTVLLFVGGFTDFSDTRIFFLQRTAKTSDFQFKSVTLAPYIDGVGSHPSPSPLLNDKRARVGMNNWNFIRNSAQFKYRVCAQSGALTFHAVFSQCYNLCRRG